MEDGIGDVDAPVYSEKKGHLVLVNLQSVQTGDLAPGASGVVAVLEVLGGQDQRREEHAAPALQSADGVGVVRLLHREVVARDVRFDEHQVVEGHLQGRIAGAGAAERLLDKSSQG